MTENTYRVIGSELSPYSVKVRSWFRFKELAHRWELRSAANEKDFRAHAKLPLVPLVITPDGQGMQDSTVLIETLEQQHAQPTVLSGEIGMDFLSALLEEFSDEWGNKWMFHLRWARDVDRASAALRLAQSMTGSDEPPTERVQMIRERMVPRVSFVGSNELTAPIIEASYRACLALLEAHLQQRDYLLGARPTMADFGFYGQLHSCSTDPTAGNWLRQDAPTVSRWVERMETPRAPANGECESWEQLAGTLFPLLKAQVGGLFLPWSDANARALAAGEESFVTDLSDGLKWQQATQKYHARSLSKIRRKYAALPADNWCRGVLDEAGCSRWLRPAD